MEERLLKAKVKNHSRLKIMKSIFIYGILINVFFVCILGYKHILKWVIAYRLRPININ